MKNLFNNLTETFISKSGIVGGITAGVFTWLFGKWEIAIQILFTCMILDYIMGLICGGKEKNLSSEIGFNGLRKKFTILVILMVAVMVDRLLGQGWIFRTLVIYFYIGIEGLSIIENAARLNAPIPEQLKDALIQLKEGNKKEVKKDTNQGA